MSVSLKHLYLIIQFELRRLFASRKGLLSLITLFAVWGLILFYPIRLAANIVMQTGQDQSNALTNFLGLGSLIRWPVIEFQVYWQITIIFLPLLSIAIAADQTSSDRKRGTLRFLTLRTTRDNIFFGRFLSVTVIQLLIILFTLITTLGLALYRDASLIPLAFTTATTILVNLVIILLPYNALMALLSAKLNSARQAIMWAILIMIVFSAIITKLSTYAPILDILQLFILGFYNADIAKVSGLIPLKLAALPLIQTAVFLTIGRWIMVTKNL